MNLFIKKYILPSILGIIAAVLLLPVLTNADIFRNGKTWEGNTRVEFTPSVSDYGYTSIYNQAMDNWRGISSNVTFTTTGSHAYYDKYHVSTTSSDGLLGRIVPYISSGNTTNLNSEWGYVRVYVFENTFAENGYSNTDRLATATHEVGHSIKLAHPSGDVSSNMNQGIGKPSSPTSYDRSELRRKWGN